MILGFVGMLYYASQRELLLQENREHLSTLTNEQIARLKSLHVSFDTEQTYPRDERYRTAIYDSALTEIFSTLTSKNVNLYEDIYLKEGYLYFIKELEFYYLGARYIALEIEAPSSWEKELYQKLFLYGTVIFLILLLVGYSLLSLLLKPMRQAITLLDRFIKDTTHELNTPINTILSNIEMIEEEALDATLAKKIRRIEIASKTISNLYEDLTYLVLSHRIASRNEEIDLSLLVEERLEYFSLLGESKKISFITHILASPKLLIDRKKISKLLDNILSNAIKYNKIGGTLTLTLGETSLLIQDTGIGIEEEKLADVFERYTRFDTSVGGFGIGLSIVMMIAQEYALHVSLSSVLGEGTEVRISW